MKKPIYIFIFLTIFIVLSHIFLSKLPAGKTKISFLNIGQGDSILIQTTNLQNILIDGGPDQKVLEELGETLPIFFNQIDLMILTHPHADHINGLVEVLKRYEVKKVLISGINYNNNFYDEFLKSIKEQKIPLEIATANKDFDLNKKIFLDILYPINSLAGKNIENVNNSSIVAKLIINSNHKILLTGDAEQETENKELLTDFDLSAEILKAGHHGSKTASSLNYLQAINPKTTIIQSGIANTFNHPHQETLDKFNNLGFEIRRNDMEGRIIFEIL
ncbi:hypothetical protein A2335_05120 [Candidatus Peregrinibacteria bacterium RIFOXYB2_FULL_32_7]|nr:MAG: hypothetical protein A2335_05120 [Candidatus Peregrinibacteria bacterium RIFOXYB2_FULL_32_7]